jgi:tRNA (guanine37-N1)-methyltransferase
VKGKKASPGRAPRTVRARSGKRAPAGARPSLRIDILSLFPGILDSAFSHSLLAKAREKGLIDIRVRDIRDEAQGRHRVADDAPYGGGDGMVMKPEPVVRSIEKARGDDGHVVLLSPAGALLDQARVRRLAARPHLVIVCGRYGGVDERVTRLAVDEEISIGDYVLGGGEPAAIVLVDAVARLVPGVVGNVASTLADSFEEGLLEHPQYTRPAIYRGLRVPEVLLSGDHAEVARWRRRESLSRTRARRPDLLAKARLSEADRRLLEEMAGEAAVPEAGPAQGAILKKPRPGRARASGKR